jgi:hypothetical protein
MCITGFIVVLIGAVTILGWYHPFEGACAGVVLFAFLIVWILVARSRSHAYDDDEEVYAAQSSRARKFVFGILLAFLWVALSALTIYALRETFVHGWFVDEPGEALSHELETLARNGAWASILSRLNRPLPPYIGRPAQARIDYLHYLALTHSAADIADAAARCAAQRQADEFAQRHSIDVLRRLAFTCPVVGRQDRPPADAKLEKLKQERDPAGRTVFTVRVSHSSGAPVAGLGAGSFIATETGREIAIIQTQDAGTARPARRFVLLAPPLRHEPDAALVELFEKAVRAVARSTDQVEEIRCCTEGADISVAIRNALGRPSAQPDALFFLTDGRDTLSRESGLTLLRALKHARVPLNLFAIDSTEAAASELQDIARESGGIQATLTQSTLGHLREVVAKLVSLDGIYLVVLDNAYPHPSLALRSARQDGAQ